MAYLQRWGDRIQRSVYICAVAPGELSELVGRVEQMIDPDTDAVHLRDLLVAAGLSGARSTRLRTGRTGRRCELSRWLVTPFGGRLRKIHIHSRVQARYLRKHGFSPGSQDRILALADLACSSLPNVLVSGPRYGVGFRSTSRRRAYRNRCPIPRQ